jgi:hypothetical protein
MALDRALMAIWLETPTTEQPADILLGCLPWLATTDHPIVGPRKIVEPLASKPPSVTAGL